MSYMRVIKGQICNRVANDDIANTNAPEAVTYSAIIYCLRCLISEEIPLNQGCLKPINVKIPKGSFLSPSSKAAVVGGNVMTVSFDFHRY